MIICNKCGCECSYDSLYCPECGEKLNTEQCRKCGAPVLPKAKYCNKCGYPTHGLVCPKCGRFNDDSAAFCPACGTRLEIKASPAVNKGFAPVAGNVAPKAKAEVSVAEQKDKKAFIYGLVRAFVLPLLLMSMFICSFFSVFKVKINSAISDIVGAEIGSIDSLAVTGVDSVRGIFLLMKKPNAEDTFEEFNDFLEDKGYMDQLEKYDDEDSEKQFGEIMAKAVTEFGTIKLYFATLDEHENPPINMTMQIIVWGLTTLSLMALTLVFFILSLIKAITGTILKTPCKYKHETLSLALIFGLTFSFIITAGGVGGATTAMLVLSALGLAAFTVLDHTVEKIPHASAMRYVKAGVTFALAIMIACFSVQNLVYTGYKGMRAEVGVDAQTLYGGMDSDTIEALEKTKAKDVDTSIAQILEQDEELEVLNVKQKRVLLLTLSPAVVNYYKDSKTYNAAQAFSWILFVSYLFYAAMTVLALYSTLRSAASPDYKKGMLWQILSLSGITLIFVSAISFTAISSSVATGLRLHSTYSLGGFIIAAFVLNVISLVYYLVLNGIEKKKARAQASTLTEQAPITA